jgi:hypothetical protein
MTRKFNIEELLKFSNEIKRVRMELMNLRVDAQKFFTKADIKKLKGSLDKFEEFRSYADDIQYDLLKIANENQKSLEEKYNMVNIFYGDQIEL